MIVLKTEESSRAILSGCFLFALAMLCQEFPGSLAHFYQTFFMGNFIAELTGKAGGLTRNIRTTPLPFSVTIKFGQDPAETSAIDSIIQSIGGCFRRYRTDT